MDSAFYDIYASYEENLKKGPPIFSQKITPPKRKISKISKFLGFDINSLVGIPAGPLPTSEFMKAAFEWGYDISTYKTVRSLNFPSHPYPNILFVDSPSELHPEKTSRLIASSENNSNTSDINITNSFGVPSLDPSIWQEDVKKALAYVGEGQLMILSFMGTIQKGQTHEDFINDFGFTAKLAGETGAKVLEVNLSCPNLGNEGLVCYDLETTEKVCKEIRKNIGNTPLLVKVGYYKDIQSLEKLAKIVNEYANGIAAINTLQVEIVNKNGDQALPGNMRLRSGVCGSCIKWAGLEMVTKLNKIRKKENYKFSIVGIGGVMTVDDYYDYRSTGADLVQSATGAMFDPYLAFKIWEKENK